MTSGSPPDLSILPLKGPSACRYRLDDDSSDTCTLPDGRKLGYAQYGCLTGKAVFWIHGLPGSRTEGAYFHDHGIELGARIIATDRPGMGLSSPQPGRTLLDWSKDVEMLAAHLGLTEYSLLVRVTFTAIRILADSDYIRARLVLGHICSRVRPRHLPKS